MVVVLTYRRVRRASDESGGMAVFAKPRIAGLLTQGLICLLMIAALVALPRLAAAQDVPGYRHTHWSAAEGAPANVRAIVQDRQGYLWVGGASGLYRFDGVRFESIRPERFERLRSTQVTALAVAADGSIWVGYLYGGLTRYADGRLRDANPERPRGAVQSIVAAPNGDVFVGVQSAFGHQIRRWRRGQWTVVDVSNGLPNEGLQQLYLDRHGVLWMGGYPHLYRRDPASGRFEAAPVELNMAPAMAEDHEGQLWVVSSEGYGPASRPGAKMLKFGPVAGGPDTGKRDLLFDADDRAWIAGDAGGLIVIPRTATTSGARTVTPVFLNALFRDREGTIWGGGRDGVHRYIRSAIIPTPVPGSLHLGPIIGGPSPYPVYVATDAGIFGVGSGAPPRQVQDSWHAMAVCADPSFLWVLNSGETKRLQNGRTTLLQGVDPQKVSTSCVVNGRGQVWEGVGGEGMFRRQGDRWVYERQWGTGTHVVWGGGDTFYSSSPMRSLNRLDRSGLHELWNREELAVGFVNVMRVIDDRLYVGGVSGLARFIGDRGVALDSAKYPWLANITGIVRRGEDLWLISDAGIVRVLSKDLDQAFAAPGAAIPHTRFGAAEGIQPRSMSSNYDDAQVDREGRLWFATNSGLIRLDPDRLHRNRLPPPVLITRFLAGGRAVQGEGVRLAAGISRIQFDFVGLSLADAGRNSYRVKLEGVDPQWIDTQGRREAIYVGLAPGRYRFRVTAANADGVWNDQGASVNFEIAPFFWQTWWFWSGVGAVALALLALVIRWRYSVALEEGRRRVEARLGERERIARDLHDTLLQGFQGLMLRFQAVVAMLPDDHRARVELERVLDRGDDVLTEGRDRVNALRRETLPTDLEQTLAPILEQVVGPRMEHALQRIGEMRLVCAPVADEIDQIVREALTNVIRHSGASRVDVILRYTGASLTVQIIDNGAGLPPDVRDKGHRDGHYGLTGMRERAVQAGGVLTISGPSGGGLDVKLVIPARIAYR